MIDFIRKHLILSVFFSFLGICLFLGDGPQMLIDVVGAGGVLVLVLVAFLYGKRQRELPLTPTLLFGGTILYFCIRTVFSDDIGYSVYTTVRMIEAFLIFSIFYVYTSEEDHALFPFYVLGFSCFSLVVSILYICIPTLAASLTKTNLLIPTYGHNNVVDILLFGIPIALMSAIKSRKSLYLFISFFLLFGVIFSFARAAMIVVSLFIVFLLLFYWKRVTKKIRITFGILFISIVGIFLMLFFVPQSSYDTYFLKAVLPKMTKEIGGVNNRFEYWRQAIEAIKERPLFGSGPGTFLLQSKRLQIAPDSYSRHAHNVLLEQLTEVGIVGTAPFVLLFLWVVIRVFRMYRKEQEKKRGILVALTSCVILQTLNAFVDFSLSYFVILMMYVSIIAIITSLEKSHSFFKSTFSIIIFTSCFFIVIIFYLVTGLCMTVFSKQPQIISSCCFLSEYSSLGVLEKFTRQLTNSELAMIKLLHKKNSTLLIQMGSGFLKQASLSDPKNFLTHINYIRYLIHEKEYRNVGEALQNVSLIFLPEKQTPDIHSIQKVEKIHSEIKNINFTNTSLYNAYASLGVDILDEHMDYNLKFAKYFYLVGLEVLPRDPQITLQFWRLASTLSPDWSFFSIELASLYNQKGDYVQSLKILNECIKNKYAVDHCSNVSLGNIPYPGFYKLDIINISPFGS